MPMGDPLRTWRHRFSSCATFTCASARIRCSMAPSFPSRQATGSALSGRNGSGKSTLLKVAAEFVEPESGERFLQPGTSLRYLPQEPDLSAFGTVRDYVDAGLDATGDAYRVPYLLGALGLTGEEAPAQLSGGEARRAALARALAPEPDILLLDEPTNHLDLAVIEWLEAELKSLRSAMVLISHDRRFLETLSRATVWIDRGVTRRLDQGFAAFEAWRDTTLDEEDTARHKLDRKIEREQHWLTYGVTARRKRNVRRLGELQGLRQERREQRRATGLVSMSVSEGETSGKRVIEAVGVSKAYGDREIVKEFSMSILRGDRIGIVGPNGAGKTTLINLLTGLLPPDSGSIKLGTKLDMVTLDQKREALDAGWTLAEALTDGRGDQVVVGGVAKHVAGYMKDFLFTPEQARTPVSVLSGGERGRLMLARALARQSNLLVLDEPTNDLDLETLDLLQEMIGEYPGTVIIVSHDRDFLDRCVTSTIVSEGGRALAGLCGRLFGHGRAARRGRVETCAQGASEDQGGKPVTCVQPVTCVYGRRGVVETQAFVQGKACARNPAGGDQSAPNRDRNAPATPCRCVALPTRPCGFCQARSGSRREGDQAFQRRRAMARTRNPARRTGSMRRADPFIRWQAFAVSVLPR